MNTLAAPVSSSPLSSTDETACIVKLMCSHFLSIITAPRRLIPVKANVEVFTANEAPPDQLIPFHHELAQVADPPQYIFFYCDLPSETGGETALIDSTLAYRFVADHHPQFMEKLKAHGARYKRTLPAEDDKESPIGRSFYNAYQVDNKTELENKLDKIEGLEYEWQPDGSLTVITEPIPAVRMIEQQHNHAIYQWTFHNSVIAAFLGWQDSRNDRMNAVCFGNNEPMDPKVLEDIAKFMDENKVSYQWQKGDVFALNNRLVMHSRNAFTGPRRVFAAMFGDAKPSNQVKRDGVGQIIKNFSALSVSDVSFEYFQLPFSAKLQAHNLTCTSVSFFSLQLLECGV